MNEWLNINNDQFIDFRISYQEIDYNVDIPSKPTSSQAYPTKSTILPNYDPMQQCSRNIKKGIKAFPKLKGSKLWDSWYPETKAQARIQDLSEVLGPLYIPISPSDELLFNEKKSFMYGVFAEVLLTDNGRSVDSTKLIMYITTVNLIDGSWRGSTEASIIH